MNASSLLDLRPLSVGELFDRTFRLYRNNFGTFLGIMLLTQVPIYLVSIVFSALTETTPNFNSDDGLSNLMGAAVVGTILASFFLLIIGLIFTQVGAAALTKAISDSYLGRQIGFWEAFQRIGGTWATLLFASFVTGFVIIGLAIPVGIIFLIPCIGPIIGFFGLIGVIAIGNVLISFIPPVVVLEKKGVFESIARAWMLSKLRFWWVFGYLFLLGLLSILFISGPTALVQYLFAAILGDSSLIFQSIVEETVNSLLSATFMPIRFAAITLMYFDLRIRFEGFDLMVLASNDDEFANDVSDLTTKTIL